jgi:FtsH Extracellular.
MSEDKNKGKSAKEQNNTTNPFERKKPKGGAPKFNPVWIYAILIMVFIGITFMGPKNGKQITVDRLLTMVEEGAVEKINVINRSKAEIYITEAAKKDDEYKKDVPDGSFVNPKAFVYYLSDIGDYEFFSNQVIDAQKSLGEGKR